VPSAVFMSAVFFVSLCLLVTTLWCADMTDPDRDVVRGMGTWDPDPKRDATSLGKHFLDYS